MKLIITGASGFVGRHLVPLLRDAGAELLLVGRDADKLRGLFPEIDACGYDGLAGRAAGHDALLHLAVLNNNADAPPDAFMAVNADQTMHLAEMAEQAGIPLFINVSSTHALDETNRSPYAVSKRAAVDRLAALTGSAAITLYCAYVFDAPFEERLRFLKNLPEPVRKLAFQAVSAVKPVTAVSRLADTILTIVKDGGNRTGEFILTEGQDDNPVYAFVRRAADILIVAVMILFFFWLLVLIWLAVRLDSTGPGVFAQARVGRDGRVFTCYKFRTMAVGTRVAGTHEIGSDTITRVGRFLRSTKLDELPQIINLARNEMSLIGFRPCLPSQTALIAERQARGIFMMRPGISGLAQVNGIDMSDPVRLARIDARYRALRSLTLDFRIAIATLIGRGRGDPASRA